MSFGNWVRRHRKALCLTQDELAQAVGCSPSLIYKIETGERRPSRQIAALLAAHLEIPPEQRELFLQQARQERASLYEAHAPQPPAPDLCPTALPAFPTALVGRGQEIDAIVRHIRDPNCRLLTLTGPGGIGKTRLAVEAARRLTPDFPGGVYFLAMEGVSLPEAILPALAGALGLAASGPADLKNQVIQALRSREALLVFDSMEHLVTGSTLFVEILEQTAHVHLLLTSREEMNLQWEWIFDVPGLPVPQEVSADMLETNSAAMLFLQRASQTAHNFYLSPDETAALVRICRLVEGLPLAIELAASWVRVMSFREIACELERNLGLLKTNLQDIPARHRSIQAVFDHSWALLADAERAALMRLSVFSGSFSRQDAQNVAGASLLLLSSLVSKSLLRYHPQTDHYDCHELIRQYARAQLQASPEEQAMVTLPC